MKRIIDLHEAEKLVKEFKTQGKTIVLAGGCFDVLHRGHLVYLENAKRQGDVLFVALESDETTQRLKGKTRPVNNQKVRAHALATFNFVDYVILLPSLASDSEYFQMTKALSPGIIAITKGDPKRKVKDEQASLVGGRVITVIKRLKEYSTTKLVNKK